MEFGIDQSSQGAERDPRLALSKALQWIPRFRSHTSYWVTQCRLPPRGQVPVYIFHAPAGCYHA